MGLSNTFISHQNISLSFPLSPAVQTFYCINLLKHFRILLGVILERARLYQSTFFDVFILLYLALFIFRICFYIYPSCAECIYCVISYWQRFIHGQKSVSTMFNCKEFLVPEMFVVALAHLPECDEWFKHSLLVHNQSRLNRFLELENVSMSIVVPILWATPLKRRW